jgi:hypothetical protein
MPNGYLILALSPIFLQTLFPLQIWPLTLIYSERAFFGLESPDSNLKGGLKVTFGVFLPHPGKLRSANILSPLSGTKVKFSMGEMTRFISDC